MKLVARIFRKRSPFTNKYLDGISLRAAIRQALIRDWALAGHINQLGPEEPQKYIPIYIETESLEEDLQAIESNGGRRLVDPIRLPDGRSFAWFQDVAGNTVGLITPR